jgi:hypothetical protein
MAESPIFNCCIICIMLSNKEKYYSLGPECKGTLPTNKDQAEGAPSPHLVPNEKSDGCKNELTIGLWMALFLP